MDPKASLDVRVAWSWMAGVAVAVPALLAYNVPPSATFLNQAAAVIGWACALACFASTANGLTLSWRSGLAGLLAALGIVAAAAVGSSACGVLPSPLTLSMVASTA